MAEAAPDRFKRYEFPRLLDESRSAMAGFLRVPKEELVFVTDTTTAVDIVLRSLHFQPGDLILYFDTIYGSCEKVIAHVVETTPVQALKLSISYPITDYEVVQLFQSALHTHRGHVRLALFETISSLPATRLPFERLTEIARQDGVLTLVDGTHGVGHLPLDLITLKPDFFVSSCHKWLFTPRGCTIFYVPRRIQALLRSALPTFRHLTPEPSPEMVFGPTIEGISLPTRLAKGDFEVQFESAGAVGSIPCLCIPEALLFRKDVCGGEARITAHCMGLARRMAVRVASILFTSSMEGDFVQDCAMFNVMLPLMIKEGSGSEDETQRNQGTATVPPEQASAVTEYITRRMLEQYGLFVAVFAYRNNWWARFSTQIYLDEGDFEYGARVLKALCEEIREGKHVQ
ncbi:hypothetical protein SLS56_000623 [Neofusicoccum ribis]|uniref:Aminotransferase class V domain-containing protein n=1 Tax=Neofusicoccum ribis TaxID=45134 RepID=A0ABR3TD92_9PEZI